MTKQLNGENNNKYKSEKRTIECRSQRGIRMSQVGRSQCKSNRSQLYSHTRKGDNGIPAHWCPR